MVQLTTIVILVGHVSHLLHLHLESLHISIRKIYMLIIRCFFKSNHNWLAKIFHIYMTPPDPYNGYMYNYV